ncbi:MAG: TatD family nuclease-associated radical SAM protein [Clostridiales bacterium]|nr:TatD family nuclease-associated radical SAM protein [Clostridiales bacterium]
MDNYLYELKGTLYLNITNRCGNRCEFCIRTNSDALVGYDMRLKKEPTFADMQKALAEYAKPFAEAVFGGYGEPTYNFDTLVRTGAYLKSLGKKVRLNTNGQAKLIHPARDVVRELAESVDEVSVSLNEADRGAYQNLCHPKFGMFTHDEILDFARECKEAGLKVRFTVVDIIPNESIRRCRKIASQMGVPLVVRRHVSDNENYT